jgi:hypothetical protein
MVILTGKCSGAYSCNVICFSSFPVSNLQHGLEARRDEDSVLFIGLLKEFLLGDAFFVDLDNFRVALLADLAVERYGRHECGRRMIDFNYILEKPDISLETRHGL